ncbi:hypothetical protein EYC84_002176 [Monilinia fructicola]|uniref:Aflatoxin regulatory protein domain-containing protein n=1 Tax=Monilinia fructicola TaxID=38448 RepID=A0A5M9JN55_MONFR|nr:hypothetical protein EYC84_002176 [Monilinia fructicola]
MVGKVQGHRRRTLPSKDTATTGADSRSSIQSPNIPKPIGIAPVATVPAIQDGAFANQLKNDQNEIPVDDNINISCSPVQRTSNFFPEENNGKATSNSVAETFSTDLTNIDTSYLGTPISGHEFLWDFSSDEGPDVLNSIALDKPSSAGSLNDSGYGDSEYDFSIHEISTPLNSHYDGRSPKRQKSNPMPSSSAPQRYSPSKRPQSVSSEKEPQHCQTDMRWKSQTQSWTRPTGLTRSHNGYSGEMHDYPESSSSFEADSGFDRGFNPLSAASQTSRFQPGMSRTPQNMREDITAFANQSQHMSFPVSPSITPFESSWRFTSKCFIITSKLQKLLRDPSSLSLDVILATNKSAVSELSQIFESTLPPSTTRSTSPEDFFSVHSGSQPDNSYDMSSMDFTPLMIYVVALKHIHDLYSQACFIFTQDDRRKRSSSTPSPRNTPSHSNSPPSSSFGLPQLDFGTFKIDIADQRRLFSEIIAKELGNCLGACTRLRSCFLMQPGDISAPTGLLEETFLGIEEGLQRMMKQIKI